VPDSTSSATDLTPDRRRLLEAIDRRPEGACAASDAVRTQGMSQAEAAPVLEVSVMTVHRRLRRGLPRQAATLGDLDPGGGDPAAS
jgi:RNA polymerase sigma-70 factor (ECF subfamily)